MTRSSARPKLRLMRHQDLVVPARAPEGSLEATSVQEPGGTSQAERDQPSVGNEQMMSEGLELCVVNEHDDLKTRNAAIRALAQREHSRGELVSKLERKGFPRETAQNAVDQLSVDGLQSDERFVEMFVRSRISRGYGPILIRQELRQREIADELVDEYLTYAQSFWVQQATAAVERRFPEPAESREAWGRRARYLARRGFASDLIYSALGDQP